MNKSEYSISPKKGYLLLPIETKVREFHAKLLLGCFAAEAGFSIIIGNQSEFLRNIQYLPHGLYVDKSVGPNKIKGFTKVREAGNRIVAWCEEGLVFFNAETYVKDRVASKAFELLDVFFAWSSNQAEAMKRKLPEDESKIKITGNPRFDLLRKPYRNIFSPTAELIKAKYGSFILINTNFGRYNHYYGKGFVIGNRKKMGLLEMNNDRSFIIDWINFQGKMFRHFVEVAKHLSRSFPNHTIIIRPHPSENHNTWKRECRNFPNVKVIHEGSVVPWIMASEVMIHNGCTTSVEAYALEEPVVCYNPIRSEQFETKLPNSLCAQASTVEDLINLLNRIFEDPFVYMRDTYKIIEKQFPVQDYISGLTGMTACEQIVNALSELIDSVYIPQYVDALSLSNGLLRNARNKAATLKRTIKRLLNFNDPGTGYLKQKFPGITSKEIKQTIKDISLATNRFNHIGVKKISGTDACFLLVDNG